MKERRMTFDVLVPIYKPDAKLGYLIHMLNRQKKKPEKIVFMITVDGEEKKNRGKDILERYPLLKGWILKSCVPI